MEGTIKWYKQEKGYGFITGEDNKDYFLHHTAMPQDQGDIRDSDEVKVTFDLKDTDRGPQAQNVVIKGKEEA